MIRGIIKRVSRNWPGISRTPEQRASWALSRIEDLTRLISEWVWETDADGHLTFVSERVIEVLGVLPIQLLGKRFIDLGRFDGENGNNGAPNWREPFRDVRFEMHGADGRKMNFLVSGLPFYTRDTWQLEGVFGIAGDISERERGEETLRDAKELAESANQARNQFLANMSHELRTPLNTVIGFSDILTSERFGPLGRPEYAEYAGHINEAGRNLLNLIDDILDVTQIETGILELARNRLDVATVIGWCVETVGKGAKDAGIALIVEVAPALPTLLADERRVKQILLNLLSNAIKFTPEGGAVILRAEATADGGMVFRVSDTGVGMTNGDAVRALSTFGQAEGTYARRYQGAGLGLPLTKSLIELHGGTLELTSETGAGTTVLLRFPHDRIVVPSAGE